MIKFRLLLTVIVVILLFNGCHNQKELEFSSLLVEDAGNIVSYRFTFYYPGSLIRTDQEIGKIINRFCELNPELVYAKIKDDIITTNHFNEGSVVFYTVFHKGEKK